MNITAEQIERLIKAGNALSVAMWQYQMDVDEDPPYKHRQMMQEWENAVTAMSSNKPVQQALLNEDKDEDEDIEPGSLYDQMRDDHFFMKD